MKKTVKTETTNKSTETTNKSTVKPTANNTKNDVVFSFRGSNSIGTTIVAKHGLKQLTNKSHDATQLILSGNSSLNLRKKTCFVNATTIDYTLLEKCGKYECVKNGNSVDNNRPHKVFFDFTELDNVCKILSTNEFNKNGFEIV